MNFFTRSAPLFLLLAATVCSTPLNDINIVPRALSPAQCSSVVSVVSVMKVNQATSFCESFLSIQTKTTTSITSVDVLAIHQSRLLMPAQYDNEDCNHDHWDGIVSLPELSFTSNGTKPLISTSVVFKPGQPPAKARRELEDAVKARNAESNDALEKRGALPSYLTAFPSSVISSGCECLNVPTPVTTVKSTSTATTTKSVPFPVKTTTVYRKSIDFLIILRLIDSFSNLISSMTLSTQKTFFHSFQTANLRSWSATFVHNEYFPSPS